MPHSRFALCAALALVLTAGFTASDDEAAVRAAYEAYKSGLLARDAEAAMAVLDTNTHTYYARMLDLALHAEADSVRALPSTDLLMVLSLRHRLNPDTLRTMDGRAVLAHGITEGWIDPSSVQGTSLGAVTVDGDTATGDVVAEGQSVGIAWTFHREEGQWKLDLTSLMPLMSQALDAMAADEDLEPAALFLDLLFYLEGHRPDETIWIPVAQR